MLDSLTSEEIRIADPATPPHERRSLRRRRLKRYLIGTVAALVITVIGFYLAVAMYFTSLYAVITVNLALVWAMIGVLILITVGPLVVVFLRR